MFLGKGVLKICSEFTGEPLCRSAISIKLLKFSAYFQITVSLEHLWSAASNKTKIYGRLLLALGIGKIEKTREF